MPNKTLISERARSLIRMRAQQDAEGAHQYRGSHMIDRMTELVRRELESEYETALMRHAKLREAVGDFTQGRGVLPWEEGDELPEVRIRRLRGG